MKFFRVYLYIIIFTFSVADLYAFKLNDSTLTLPDFRDVEWNCSMDDVRENETARYLQSFSGFGIEALSFRGSISGLEARIDYTFKNENFIEGSYTVISENTFQDNFQTLLTFLENRYGKPGYRSGLNYNSDSVWNKINDYGSYTGPSLYWVFNNGFIGLISEKYKDEITLTILYAFETTIDEYNSQNYVDSKVYKIIR